MFIDRSMTKDVIAIGPDTGILEAQSLMAVNRIRHLPVVDGDNTLLGIVTDRDVRSALPSNLLPEAEIASEEKRLAVLRRKNVFIEGGHYTFGYLARRYHIRYISAVGISPNAESRPRDLIALSKQVRQYGLKYVYSEELVSPRVAQTIARETGAQLLELNGAHNLTRDEMKQGVSFLDLMERNLKNLKIGLECE
jgi:CBS domain-containing protein